MAIVDELNRTLETFPPISPDPNELARLRLFLAEMKIAGIAKTREYDLPQPDTIGHTATKRSQQRA